MFVKSSLYINNRQPYRYTAAYRMCSGGQQWWKGVGGAMTELDLTYSVGMHVFLPAKILYHGSLTTPQRYRLQSLPSCCEGRSRFCPHGLPPSHVLFGLRRTGVHDRQRCERQQHDLDCGWRPEFIDACATGRGYCYYTTTGAPCRPLRALPRPSDTPAISCPRARAKSVRSLARTHGQSDTYPRAPSARGAHVRG